MVLKIEGLFSASVSLDDYFYIEANESGAGKPLGYFINICPNLGQKNEKRSYKATNFC